MLYGSGKMSPCGTHREVLILIFLENALRRKRNCHQNHYQKVLILIFLENALRLLNTWSDMEQEVEVLILIFLENALRLSRASLNPGRSHES